MKINEIGTLNLNELHFKLSKNSITVKGEDNKTKAIINDIKRIDNLQPNRKYDLHKKYGNELLRYFDNLYINEDNQAYYIIDKKHLETSIKLYNNGIKDEFKRLNNKITELNNLKVNVLFLNVG